MGRSGGDTAVVDRRVSEYGRDHSQPGRRGEGDLLSKPGKPTFNLVVKEEPRGVYFRELESRRDFTSLAKANLRQFVEDKDYEVFNNPVKNSGGRPRKD